MRYQKGGAKNVKTGCENIKSFKWLFQLSDWCYASVNIFCIVLNNIPRFSLHIIFIKTTESIIIIVTSKCMLNLICNLLNIGWRIIGDQSTCMFLALPPLVLNSNIPVGCMLYIDWEKKNKKTNRPWSIKAVQLIYLSMIVFCINFKNKFFFLGIY